MSSQHFVLSGNQKGDGRDDESLACGASVKELQGRQQQLGAHQNAVEVQRLSNWPGVVSHGTARKRAREATAATSNGDEKTAEVDSSLSGQQPPPHMTRSPPTHPLLSTPSTPGLKGLCHLEGLLHRIWEIFFGCSEWLLLRASS